MGCIFTHIAELLLHLLETRLLSLRTPHGSARREDINDDKGGNARNLRIHVRIFERLDNQGDIALVCKLRIEPVRTTTLAPFSRAIRGS